MRRFQTFREAHKKQKHETEKKCKQVTDHPKTEKMGLDRFPDIEKYLADKFPDVDVSGIPIYMATPGAFRKAGWEHIGGCYIHHMNLILVKKTIKASKNYNGRFLKLLNKYSAPMDVKDVVVHEMLHAISGKVNRSSRRFTHMEEEFVYTNCIDYYKSKGLSDKEIVEGNFLPFCINDVTSNRKEFSAILTECQLDMKEIKLMSEDDLAKEYDASAKKIVPKVLEKAKEKGYRMIELYDKYGRGVSYHSNAVCDDASASRFASLDFDDCEF